MKQLQITVLKEYYLDTIEDCRTMGISILTASFSDNAATLIVEGEDCAIDMMEEFLNGTTFI